MLSYRTLGNTMAEYGLVGGLLIIAVLGGLIALGGGLKDLLSGFNSGLEQREKLQSGFVASYNHKSSNLPGSDHNIVVHNPNSAQPVLEVLNHQQVEITVAGIDGTRENSLGSLMLANGFETLANHEPDPASADYIRKLAEISYYLGAAEGNVDGVQSLRFPTTQDNFYNSANAVSDIYDYHAQMKKLLASPPATMDDRTKQQLVPLAAEVTQISQSYLDHYKAILTKDGNVNYAVPIDVFKGNGKPGSSLGKPITGNYTYNGTFYKQVKSYNDFVSYTDMKAMAARVLAENKVESVKVVTTLTDAQKTDKLADQLDQLKKDEEDDQP